MIRNIIFDLGNVLISFRPEEYLIKNNYPEAKRKIIHSDIFGSNEWLLLDNGEISTPEAIDSIAGKSSLRRQEIALIFNKRTEIMSAVDNNTKLVPGLKKVGYRLYYLSNFPADIFDEVKRSYPFFKYFDGGIISAIVRYSKPNPEIFRLLLEKYGLNPSECFFIDDHEENILVAESIGMKGFCTSGSTNISDEFFKRLDGH
jgi:haloacid dehalogenase superfamily, subfamily IA, variant 3 with third motif having DD or ED